MGLIGSFALYRLLSLPRPLTFLIHLITWYNIDTLIFSALAQSSPAHAPTRAAHERPGGIGFLGPWLLREIMALPIWLVAMCGSTIEWRGSGKRYRLRLNGTVAVEETSQPITL